MSEAGKRRAGFPAWEPSWPERRLRRPRFFDPYYLHYSAVARSLEQARDRYITRPIDILDVGCGDMPYYPLFASVASDYAGADVVARPRVRYVCPAERLTVPDASADLVLCTQVLEHVRAPATALAEIARVLGVGGHVFATTHGVWPFHPFPGDYWRWTHQGLEALFESVEALTLLEIVPHRGTASCLALLLNYYAEVAARRARLTALGWAASAALNCAGLIGDRIERLRYPHPDTLIHNFLVVACRE